MIAKERPKLRVLPLFRESVEDAVNLICEYRQSVKEKYSQELARLEKYAEKYSYIEPPDDFFILNEIKEMSNQLSIVALYCVIEHTSKNILKRRYKSGRKERKVDRFNIKTIITMLSEDGIDLPNIDYFSVAEEIRLLNNAIKHN